MKILVFGKTGQLAHALQQKFPQSDYNGSPIEVVFLGREQADFTKLGSLKEAIDHHHPDAVINAAAYTAVDKAESEQALAQLVNCTAPAEIAAACKAIGNIPLIHFSTDFVFNGQGATPYLETDETDPLNVYGYTKLAGENAISVSGARYAILRTSWVFSGHGSNFVKSMLRLAQNNKDVKIVADEQGQPTAAADLADAAIIVACLMVQNSDIDSGIYHYSGRGPVNWADFATEIFQVAGKEVSVTGTTASEYQQEAERKGEPKALRPAYSVMNCEKIEAVFGISPQDWRLELAKAIAALQP